jgi:hypothetical protein
VEAQDSRSLASIVIALNIVVTAITFLKGRLMLGLISIFVPVVGLVCSVRLAKPHSPWSHWFYTRRPHQLERAHERSDERDRRWKELKDRFYDLIGGAPSQPRRVHPKPQVVSGYLSATPHADEADPSG